MERSKGRNWMATAGAVAILVSSLAGCSMAKELQNLVGADDGTQDPAEGSNEAGKDPSSKGEPTSEPIEEQTEAPSPSATESPTSNETGPDLEDGALWDCLDLAAGMQWMAEEFEVVTELSNEGSWSPGNDDGEMDSALDALEVSVESFGEKVEGLNSPDLVPAAEGMHQAWEDLEKVMRRISEGEAPEHEIVEAGMAADDALEDVADECMVYFDGADDL